MKIEREPPDSVQSFYLWLRAMFYIIIGACMFSGGSIVLIFSMSLSWTHIELMPEGGGWLSVIDAGIKGGLLGGFLSFLGALLSYFGVLVFNRGRKIRAYLAAHDLNQNSRPPVLYLRSFSDDELTESTESISAAGISLFTVTTQHRKNKPLRF